MEDVKAELPEKMIAAIANSEPRALTVATLGAQAEEGKALHTRSELYELLQGIQGPDPVWTIDQGAIWRYCHDYLEPLHMVGHVSKRWLVKAADSGTVKKCGPIKTPDESLVFLFWCATSTCRGTKLKQV